MRRLPYSARSLRLLGGVGVRVVEGIERAAALDDEFEAIANARVLDRNGQRVVERAPQQKYVHTVALAGGQFATDPSGWVVRIARVYGCSSSSRSV